MSESKTIRLNKILRKLNISLDRAVEFLEKKGYKVEAKPSAKISGDVYQVLLDGFQTDANKKAASKEVGEEKRKEKEAIRFEQLNDYKQYLKVGGKSESTINSYVGAFKLINHIAKANEITEIENWESSNVEEFVNQIKNDKSYINRNASGNNMYSAALNHYIKFMEQKNEITPKLPFESFGWRWASTGIASHLNQPNTLRAVLDAILINGNGSNNYTSKFETLLYSICVNKYSFTKEQAEKLTKPLKFIGNDPITVIENSANYWFHLGLLSKTGKHAIVSELGIKFLTGELSEDNFVSTLIDSYSLPNKAFSSVDINRWQSAKLKIYPLKLIQNIFVYLSENYKTEEQYLTESDLVNIVIPCSFDLEKFSIKEISKHIVRYRKTSENYSSWPKPQDNYSTDKGYRMANEFLYFLEVFDFLSSNSTNVRGYSDKKYFATNKLIGKIESVNLKNDILGDTPQKFNISNFEEACLKSNLKYSNQLITRYISSLATKPFVLLSGLSGSGKTKLAQSFSQWICQDKSQYCIVPVGADWTSREPLLGYVNALDNKEYILPENGALNLIIEANKQENQSKPYFLILDEMNLSHVERYFADFLSVMESKDKFKLHSSKRNLNITNGIKDATSIEVPNTLNWTKNLFVIGTVNIDETTYMFSPKVLDRANVIEFKVSETEIEEFLDSPNEIDLTQLEFKGANTALSFIEIAKNKEFETTDNDSLNRTLVDFFVQLKKTGAEFGYRSGMEIHRLNQQLSVINTKLSENDKIDIAVMQKLLPKLHGSRRKLIKILNLLAQECLEENQETIFNERGVYTISEKNRIKYQLSFDKIARMYKNLIENGFASYAEA